MKQLIKKLSAVVAVWVLASVWITSSWANPQFSHTEAGDIRIEESGAVYNIYSADRSIGAFNSFSNSAGETINSIQAAADHSVIFKVIGQSPSEIFGALNANSRVFLVNPNGIIFHPGSQVNAPGLVAAAMDLKSADFDSREFTFEAPVSGGYVLNNGSINASEGGYVALIGSAVENRGTITAPGGNIVLASGGAATVGLDGDGGISVKVTKPLESPVYDLQGNAIQDGLKNSGTLSAPGGAVLLTADAMEEVFDQAINHTGVIEAQAVEERNGIIILSGGRQGVVSVSGQIDADGIDAGETGGEIRVTGEYVGLFDGARVTASGDAGGGTILVGGDYKGENPAIQNATAAFFGPDALMRADALSSGDGGKVILWSDNSTRAYGTISAIGGLGGIGGFVETSGKNYLSVEGARVTAGQWLLDPYNVTITSSTSFGTFSGGNPDTWTPSGPTSSTILNTTINTSLNAGTSVIIQTAGGGGGDPGDIVVDAPITKSAGGDATLTLTAAEDIFINASFPITSTSGKLNVTLNAGATATLISIDSMITTNGGNFTALAPVGNINLAGLTNILDLTSGNASLTASTGLITSGDAGALTEIKTTGSVTLSAKGTSANPISLEGATSLIIIDQAGIGNFSIQELVAATILSTNITVTTASSQLIDIDYFGTDVVDINDINAINLVTLARAGSSFLYSASLGDITVASITAASSVTITAAAGSINEDLSDPASDITTPTLSLTAATGIGSGLNIEVDVTTLALANITGAGGGIHVEDVSGGMTVTSATTPDGFITFKATGGDLTITNAQMTGGANNATLQTLTSGNIYIDNLVSTGGVNITSTGSIEESGSDSATDIKGTGFTLTAVSGIGNSAQIEIEANTLSSVNVSGTGGISLNDKTGSLTVNTVTTNDGGITLNVVAGNMDADIITAGGIGRNIFLSTTSSGNVTVGNVTASGDIITINSAGSILEGGGDGSVDLTAQSASLTAATGIFNVTVASPIQVDLDILTLAQVTGVGGINLSDASSGLIVTNATTFNGAIYLHSFAISLQVNQASSDTGVAGANDIFLTNTVGPMTIGAISSDDIASFIPATGAILDGNGDALNVTATTAIFDTSLGHDVGMHDNFIEVIAGTIDTSAVDLSDMLYICAGTDCDAGESAAEEAGLILEGNRIVGGENFEEFASDASTVTEAGGESGEESQAEEGEEGEEGEEEGEEESGSGGSGQSSTGTRLVSAPASFPDEKPVQTSTFAPCAV